MNEEQVLFKAMRNTFLKQNHFFLEKETKVAFKEICLDERGLVLFQSIC